MPTATVPAAMPPLRLTDVRLVREGRVLAAGPMDEALRADVLSAAFGLDLEVERRPNGRFSAWAR